MKLLRRNTVEFLYYPLEDNRNQFADNMDPVVGTRWYKPVYGQPVIYRGNISVANGFAQDSMLGVETPYTHTLLMDNMTADISVLGLVGWNGKLYEVKAVRRSLNVLNIALKESTMMTVDIDEGGSR